MELLYKLKTETYINGNTAVALGVFDGLHVGHMALIDTLINQCKSNGLKSVVYTFSKHPSNAMPQKASIPLLSTVHKKAEILSRTRLDYLYVEEFNSEFSKISPELFVQNVLIKKFNIKFVIVGFNYKFGNERKGDVKLLAQMGSKFGFGVTVIPPVIVNNSIVSSTEIRRMISEGEVYTASKLLGRVYSVEGPIVEGKRVGAQLGFPTANVCIKFGQHIPKRGVYVTKILIDGILYDSVTNIGYAPTLGILEELSIETYIIDFQREIYGKTVEVLFFSKIRDEVLFKSKGELIQQITKDVKYAKEFLLLNAEN